MRRPDPRFWKGRRVLLTGHTGFKGAWLAMMLDTLGARVSGFALAPEPGPNAFDLTGAARVLDRAEGDLRDPVAVDEVVARSRADIVLHLAAQAIVARGHADPAGTFATNVSGTVALLEALRRRGGWEAALIVTSDKVYRNDGRGEPFVEGDPLGGADPYSASKAACEIAVHSYRRSFPLAGAVGTARAGNVVGGGDFGEARLIPDLVRAELKGEPLLVRRPAATRPFQHVLDVLCGYLLLAEDLALRPETTPEAVNFGPDEPQSRVDALLAAYGEARGRTVNWLPLPQPAMPEAATLALDSRLAREALDWRPCLGGAAALARTARWYDAWMRGEDVARLSRADVEEALAA